MNTSILNPAMIDTVWPSIEPYLIDAIEESAGELIVSDLKRRIEDTTAIALCVLDDTNLLAVGLLERITFPSGKVVLGVIALGGVEMSKWVDEFDSALIKIMEEQGCNEIRIVGRPGWVKVLKSLGWESTHVILSKRG